jgi:hypothetical protein
MLDGLEVPLLARLPSISNVACTLRVLFFGWGWIKFWSSNDGPFVATPTMWHNSLQSRQQNNCSLMYCLSLCAVLSISWFKVNYCASCMRITSGEIHFDTFDLTFNDLAFPLGACRGALGVKQETGH